MKPSLLIQAAVIGLFGLSPLATGDTPASQQPAPGVPTHPPEPPPALPSQKPAEPVKRPSEPPRQAFDPLDKPGEWVAALNNPSRSKVHDSLKKFKWWQGDPNADQADLDDSMYRYQQKAAPDDELAKGMLDAYRRYREERGEVPFQYLQVAQQRTRKRAIQKERVFITLLFSGPENFINAFPEDQREEIAADFAKAADPDAERMTTANKMLVSLMKNIPRAEVEAGWRVAKTLYAKDAFNWQGKREITEKEFYDLAGRVLLSMGSDAEYLSLQRPIRVEQKPE